MPTQHIEKEKAPTKRHCFNNNNNKKKVIKPTNEKINRCVDKWRKNVIKKQTCSKQFSDIRYQPHKHKQRKQKLGHKYAR